MKSEMAGHLLIVICLYFILCFNNFNKINDKVEII